MAASSTTVALSGITVPDKDITKLQRFACDGTNGVRVGAICDTASKQLQVRVVFWDSQGQLAPITAPTTFTSDTDAIDGTLFAATPSPDAWYPSCGCAAFSVHVDSVSGGTWTIQALAG